MHAATASMQPRASVSDDTEKESARFSSAGEHLFGAGVLPAPNPRREGFCEEGSRGASPSGERVPRTTEGLEAT